MIGTMPFADATDRKYCTVMPVQFLTIANMLYIAITANMVTTVTNSCKEAMMKMHNLSHHDEFS